MTKKLPLKKQKTRIKKDYALWTVIVVLSALLLSCIWYIAKTSSDSVVNPTSPSQQTPVSKAEIERMQAFVNDIEQRRYRYPVIDIKENRVYIPEVRMYLPLNESSRDIRYQGRGEELWLSTAMAVGRQTDDKDASCDRVVIVTSKREVGGYISEGNIESASGETLYIFRHPPCEIYGDSTSKSLAEVVKEAKYY